MLSFSPLVGPCLFTTSRFVLFVHIFEKCAFYKFVCSYCFNYPGHCRRIVRMAATARNPSKAFESVALKPPLHPTYDLKGIIKLALAEDAGGQGYLVFYRFYPIFPLPTNFNDSNI
jgi:hypothetical protein